MFDVVGEDVLITGARSHRYYGCAICNKNGARNVIITDLNDYRLELAKKLGATATVNVTRDSLEKVMKNTVW